MSQYLLARDTVAGMEGTAVMTDSSGKNRVLFQLTKIKTVADIQSTEMKVVGTRVIQDKAAGAKQTGTATLYYGSPYFTQMVLEYLHTGVMPYFDIQITNSDPTTSIGSQVMAYYGCTLTGTIPLSILNDEEAMLNYDFNFAYTKVARLQAFNDPTQLGN